MRSPRGLKPALRTLSYRGGALCSGDVDGETFARITFDYRVPYVVSSIGFLPAVGFQ